MALTIASTSAQSGDVWGRQKTRIVTVTFDSSYATGGESFTPALVGLTEFTLVVPVPDAAVLPGYVIQYDYTNKKLIVFGVEQDADGADTDRLDEEDSAVDLSTLVIRVLCVGH
jgi:hypothetical protein